MHQIPGPAFHFCLTVSLENFQGISLLHHELRMLRSEEGLGEVNDLIGRKVCTECAVKLFVGFGVTHSRY